MPTFSAAQLHRLILLIVRRMGSREAEARTVADHLVGANLAGHDSHGLGMLPDYIRLLHEGLLVPSQDPVTVSDAGAVLVLDAGRGFGAAMASEAMRRGAERAKGQGATVVALRNSADSDRIGTYGEQCAAVGLASIHSSTSPTTGPIRPPSAAVTRGWAPTPSVPPCRTARAAPPCSSTWQRVQSPSAKPASPATRVCPFPLIR